MSLFFTLRLLENGLSGFVGMIVYWVFLFCGMLRTSVARALGRNRVSSGPDVSVREKLVARAVYSFYERYMPGFRNTSLGVQRALTRAWERERGDGNGEMTRCVFREHRVFGAGYCGFSAFLQASSGLLEHSFVRFMDVELLLHVFERFVETMCFEFVREYRRSAMGETVDADRSWWASSGTMDVISRIFHVSVGIWVRAGAGGNGKVLLRHVSWGCLDPGDRFGTPMVHLLYDEGAEHYSVLEPSFSKSSGGGGYVGRVYGDLEELVAAACVDVSGFRSDGVGYVGDGSGGGSGDGSGDGGFTEVSIGIGAFGDMLGWGKSGAVGWDGGGEFLLRLDDSLSDYERVGELRHGYVRNLEQWLRESGGFYQAIVENEDSVLRVSGDAKGNESMYSLRDMRQATGLVVRICEERLGSTRAG